MSEFLMGVITAFNEKGGIIKYDLSNLGCEDKYYQDHLKLQELKELIEWWNECVDLYDWVIDCGLFFRSQYPTFVSMEEEVIESLLQSEEYIRDFFKE